MLQVRNIVVSQDGESAGEMQGGTICEELETRDLLIGDLHLA